MESFYRKEVGKGVIGKRKQKIFSGNSLRRKRRGSFHVDYLIFFWGDREDPVIDSLTGTDQKISD